MSKSTRNSHKGAFGGANPRKRKTWDKNVSIPVAGSFHKRKTIHTVLTGDHGMGSTGAKLMKKFFSRRKTGLNG